MINRLRFSILCLVVIGFWNTVEAQNTFKARAFAGITASQIRGDLLAGYDKLGLTGGLQMAVEASDRFDIALEFQFIQKGSQAQFTFGSPIDIRRTTLNYVEVPVMAVIKDWYIEDGGYYKVKGHLGFSYGRLIDVSSSNGAFQNSLGNFKRGDFALVVGGSYAINPKMEIVARYSNSFVRIYENEQLGTDGLINYLWSFTLSYGL